MEHTWRPELIIPSAFCLWSNGNEKDASLVGAEMLRLIYLVNLSPSRQSVIISCYQRCLWSPPHHRRRRHLRKEKANCSQLYDIVILNCSHPSEKNISRQRCFHLPRWLKDVHLVVFIVASMTINDTAVRVFFSLLQNVAQGRRDLAWRAANRTAVACSEALGTRTPRTTAASVTSTAKMCPTTW